MSQGTLAHPVGAKVLIYFANMFLKMTFSNTFNVWNQWSEYNFRESSKQGVQRFKEEEAASISSLRKTTNSDSY